MSEIREILERTYLDEQYEPDEAEKELLSLISRDYVKREDVVKAIDECETYYYAEREIYTIYPEDLKSLISNLGKEIK